MNCKCLYPNPSRATDGGVCNMTYHPASHRAPSPSSHSIRSCLPQTHTAPTGHRQATASQSVSSSGKQADRQTETHSLGVLSGELGYKQWVVDGGANSQRSSGNAFHRQQSCRRFGSPPTAPADICLVVPDPRSNPSEHKLLTRPPPQSLPHHALCSLHSVAGVQLYGRQVYCTRPTSLFGPSPVHTPKRW